MQEREGFCIFVGVLGTRKSLGGGSPLQAWQQELLANDKGVRCEAESEGSRRQNLGLTNRNYI